MESQRRMVSQSDPTLMRNIFFIKVFERTAKTFKKHLFLWWFFMIKNEKK